MDRRAASLLLAALALGSCAMGHSPATPDATEIEDPIEVTPTGRPNAYLLCPERACAAPAEGASPTFQVPRERLEQAWLAVMQEQPRIELIAEDAARDLYLFRQRSAVFGFPDLISVRFLDAPGGGSTLAVYSRSVYGYYDFGVNRRRVEDWVATLRAEVGQVAVLP